MSGPKDLCFHCTELPVPPSPSPRAIGNDGNHRRANEGASLLHAEWYRSCSSNALTDGDVVEVLRLGWQSLFGWTGDVVEVHPGAAPDSSPQGTLSTLATQAAGKQTWQEGQTDDFVEVWNLRWGHLALGAWGWARFCRTGDVVEVLCLGRRFLFGWTGDVVEVHPVARFDSSPDTVPHLALSAEGARKLQSGRPEVLSGGAGRQACGDQRPWQQDITIDDIGDQADRPGEDTTPVVHVATANVNSMTPHIDQLCDLADVVVIAGTRVQAVNVGSVRRLLAKKGFECSLRAEAQGGILGTGHEGVAVMVRKPMRVCPVVLPNELQEWVSRGRLDIVQVQPTSGPLLTVCAHYGYPDWRTNEEHAQAERQLISSLAEWKAKNNVQYFLMAGDFNATSADGVYGQAIYEMQLHDPFVGPDGQRAPTYRNPVGASHIDHLLIDAYLSPHVRASRLEETFETHHKPLVLECAFPEEDQVVQPTIPKSDDRMLVRMNAEKASGWVWPHGEAALVAAFQQRQVEPAWRAWCERWEELLLQRMIASGARPSKAYRGRGQLPELKAPAKQHCNRGAEGPETLRLRQWRRLQGMCLEAQFQLSYYGRIQESLARRVRRRLQQERLWGNAELLDQAGLSAALEQVQQSLRAAKEEDQQARLRYWKRSMQLKGMKRAYAYISDNAYPTLQALRSSDGVPVMGVAGMYQELQRFWHDIYNPKHQMNPEDMSALIYSWADKWLRVTSTPRTSRLEL